jgi:uncharacterized protein (TIGR03118 family)
MLAVWAGLVAICAQAGSFFSCSFSSGGFPTAGPFPPPVPSLTISVNPTSIVLGQSAVVTWSSSGATSCTASGAWSGAQSPQGNTRVTPTTTGSLAYVLNCSTPTGSIAQSATLTVSAMAAASRARGALASGRGARLVRTDLVADVAGTRASNIDAQLAEPWGLVFPDGLAAAMANRGSNRSTSYDGAGTSQPAPVPQQVRLPSSREGSQFGAAGVVANSSDGFVVSAAGRAAPARLLYAGRSGLIAGWSPEVDINSALIAYAAEDASSYTALAIATSSTPSESRLYATDFRNARIDVFDSAFRKQVRSATRFAFREPVLPPGYAPFGIAVGGDLVYVTYAQRLASSDRDPLSAPGAGIVEVFTMEGDFITRLVTSGGALNAPWAIVRAPADGSVPFAGALLVGNTGDGRINAFDAATGALLGTLTDAGGAALVVPNLHGLAFGNDFAGQPRVTLFFTAGAHDGAHGWYGRLDFAAAGR